MKEEDLKRRILAEAGERKLGVKPQTVISWYVCREIAEAFKVSMYEVEMQALQQSVVPERYCKNLQALGIKEQIALLEAKVALIGLGGLGGYLLEMFSRLGVGCLGIADGDEFEAHNLNRQLLSTEACLGQSKLEQAEKKVENINNAVQIEVYPGFLDYGAYQEFLQGKQLVVDALGGVKEKEILLQAANSLQIPVISGIVAGEMGFVSTVFPGDRGPVDFWSGSVGAEEELGTLVYTVAMVASMQCAETVHILIGRTPHLRGKIAVLDFLDFQWDIYNL